MNYEQFRRNSVYWNRMNYSQGFPNHINMDEELRTHTENCLRELNLFDIRMNGNSIIGLPRIEDAENGNTVIYSEIFRNMTAINSYFSPAYYAYKIVEMYSDNTEEFNAETAKGYICRGLRTLASMIREMCMEYKIKARLPEVTINTGVGLDIGEHTDLMINYVGNEFRIWSYQSNMLNYTVRRLRYNRRNASLPSGLYVLCPLNIHEPLDREDVNGWYMYSDNYIDRVVELLQQGENENTDRYSNVIRGRTDEEIRAYISQIKIMVKDVL